MQYSSVKSESPLFAPFILHIHIWLYMWLWCTATMSTITKSTTTSTSHTQKCKKCKNAMANVFAVVLSNNSSSKQQAAPFSRKGVRRKYYYATTLQQHRTPWEQEHAGVLSSSAIMHASSVSKYCCAGIVLLQLTVGRYQFTLRTFALRITKQQQQNSRVRCVVYNEREIQIIKQIDAFKK